MRPDEDQFGLSETSSAAYEVQGESMTEGDFRAHAERLIHDVEAAQDEGNAEDVKSLREELRDLLHRHNLTANEQGSLEDLDDISPDIVDWNVLLDNPGSMRRALHWRRSYKEWILDPKKYEAKLRRILRPPRGMEWSEFKEYLTSLFQDADAVVDKFFDEMFPDHPGMKNAYSTHGDIRKVNDVLDLMRIMYGPEKELREQYNLKSDELSAFRYEAYRKFALALVIRSATEHPEYKNRKKNSDDFELDLLRDEEFGLMYPETKYEAVSVWFRVDPETGLSEYSFSSPDHKEDDWEHTKLLKVKISGPTRIKGHGPEEMISLTVFCFPGSKYEIDMRDGSIDSQIAGLRGSIVDYKSKTSIAGKMLRGKEIGNIKDLLRFTMLVEDPEDLPILEGMLSTAFGSSIGRAKHAPSGKKNGASSSKYSGCGLNQTVEEIHNPEGDNYYIEARTGTLEKVLSGLTRRPIDVGHHQYMSRRTAHMINRLFPPEFFSDLRARALERLKQVTDNTSHKIQLTLDGLDAPYLSPRKRNAA